MLIAFLLAFVFSFLGSIPPGTLNLTIIGLGIDNKIDVARRFALAAAIVEYPYGWLAIRFERLISSSPVVIENLQLLAGLVMLLIGVINLLPAKGKNINIQRFSDSGFRRGLVLSVLNPLAIPFWIGVTAYLKGTQLTRLDTPWLVHTFLFGVSAGAFSLLMLFAFLAKRMTNAMSEHQALMKRIPGTVLVILGLYAVGEHFV